MIIPTDSCRQFTDAGGTALLMLPAYFSASYLGGFPASLGLYQQLQHLSRSPLDASSCVPPISLPFPPHGYPRQRLIAMTTSGSSDADHPLSPSQHFASQQSSPVTSGVMTSSFEMAGPISMSAGSETASFVVTPDTSNAIASYSSSWSGTTDEERRAQEERKTDKEQEGRTAPVQNCPPDVQHEDYQHMSEEKAGKNLSGTGSPTRSLSPCSQPADFSWKPSTSAVKFSIDSILGLDASARVAPQRQEPREPTSSVKDGALMGGGCTWAATSSPSPYTQCPCIPPTSSHSPRVPSSTHNPPTLRVPMATVERFGSSSSSVPSSTPSLTIATSTSIRSPHLPQHCLTTSSSSSPPMQNPFLQGQQLAPGLDGEGRKVGSGEESQGEEKGRGGEKKQGEEQASFPWLQCSRYHPPKLQRSKKKDGGGKKRKLGRNPRVPFTQHQVAVLEEKFRRTHYLSSMDVAELSSALSLSETRVKIWFQNRRARERREREASQRAQLLTQKPYQPLSIPSVTWTLTSQLSSGSPFLGQRYRHDLPFRAGLFPSALSAFTSPLPSDVNIGPSSSSVPWPEGHSNSDDDNLY